MASTGSNSSVPEAEVAASRADIVVALTSYNDVRTVGAVARAVQDGLAQHFGSARAQIVLADAGSTDGTREAARDAVGAAGLVELEYPRSPVLDELPYHGQPYRSHAVRAVLQSARQAEARACALIDAGLHTVQPAWVERLIAPVLAEKADYVSPHYVRHIHEGAITKGIVYPIFRALYGVRLRQPAAGEFGCSARLIGHYLEQDFWEAEQASVGIDLWLAAAAVCGGFGACEASLGVPHEATHDKPPDLSTALAQVVGALFTDVERHADVWQRVRGSAAIPILGEEPLVGPEARPPHVEGMIESFRLGYRELREIWTWVLPPRTIVELRKLAAAAPEQLRFDDRLWASIVYDYAFAFSQHVMPRNHLLRSLAPLYSGWLASFILQLPQATLADVEARVERLCLGFEAEKRHLISRWRWPERLR